MDYSIILQQKGGGNQRFVISGPTCIGKAIRKDWYVNRKEPDIFKDLERLIHIPDSRFISRSHAAIYPKDDKFYIQDLNSQNGTTVNGGRLHGSHLLKKGDLINLAGDFLLRYENILEADTNNHAILVGDPGSNLKGVQKDLDELIPQLEKRGFSGNIHQIYGSSLNVKKMKSEVLDRLRQISYLTGSQSHILFYFSGHGGPNGINVGTEHISPFEKNSK